MDTLTRLMQWYIDQCDGDWEHRFGISIETLDNPGWSISADLQETSAADSPFTPIAEPEDGGWGGDERSWLEARVEDGKFRAYCGPLDLARAFEVFLHHVGRSPGWEPSSADYTKFLNRIQRIGLSLVNDRASYDLAIQRGLADQVLALLRPDAAAHSSLPTLLAVRDVVYNAQRVMATEARAQWLDEQLAEVYLALAASFEEAENGE